MVDDLFGVPRLAVVYDALEPAVREDLAPYQAIVREFGARQVLDVGCGTGELACLLAKQGVDVVGVDPAAASLEVAKGKEFADRVRWIHGDATSLPELQVDLAVMTGNVAQVFLTDEDWAATLAGIHAALKPGGRFVFETRVPARRAWEEWFVDRPHEVRVVGGDVVEHRGELVSVVLPFVSFKGHYRFESDGAIYESQSTLRFRERDEVEASLTAAGFSVDDVRDAPDRPGLEYVFIARR
jgi:SAM-dependent methyltransferase